MIGSFAAGTTNPLVAKNLTKIFFYIFVILWYLEEKITRAILYFFSMGSYDST